MNKMLRVPRGSGICALVAIALAGPIVSVATLQADEESARKEEKNDELARDLVGTWKLTGALYVDEEQVRSRLKFFTGKHWNITHPKKDGTVLYHHGGTYTLNGDEYTEKIEYANQNTANMIGATFKFKIKIEGDKLTQVGINNNFHEIWERAK